MIALRCIPLALAMLLVSVSCLPSVTAPRTTEPRVYVSLTSDHDQPALVQDPAPRPGFLYIGVPFEGGLSFPDAGSMIPGPILTIVCDPAGDCNPPNKILRRPADALRVAVQPQSKPGTPAAITIEVTR
jgi:hypothetical protein